MPANRVRNATTPALSSSERQSPMFVNCSESTVVSWLARSADYPQSAATGQIKDAASWDNPRSSSAIPVSN